jgi:hypothetical protein
LLIAVDREKRGNMGEGILCKHEKWENGVVNVLAMQVLVALECQMLLLWSSQCIMRLLALQHPLRLLFP